MNNTYIQWKHYVNVIYNLDRHSKKNNLLPTYRCGNWWGLFVHVLRLYIMQSDHYRNTAFFQRKIVAYTNIVSVAKRHPYPHHVIQNRYVWMYNEPYTCRLMDRELTYWTIPSGIAYSVHTIVYTDSITFNSLSATKCTYSSHWLETISLDYFNIRRTVFSITTVCYQYWWYCRRQAGRHVHKFSITSLPDVNMHGVRNISPCCV